MRAMSASESSPTDTDRFDRLEARVRALEDVNAIRNLKARYAELCDNSYDPDGLAALFTEHAVWESEALGNCNGREEIRAFFAAATDLFSFAIHYSLNSQIEVDGDRATAQWYLFMPCTRGSDSEALWRAAVENETYVRVDGRWMFERKQSRPLFSTTFAEGWSRVPHL
jgi:ketosteroid isomerase-like protein